MTLRIFAVRVVLGTLLIRALGGHASSVVAGATRPSPTALDLRQH